MDGGVRQKAKTEELKKEIKLNTAHKREMALVPRSPTTYPGKDHFNVLSDMSIASNTLDTQTMASPNPGGQKSMSGSAITANHESSLIASLPWSHQQHERSDTLQQASASEMDFVMKYLDFVFPTLYPFYQSHMFETGRSWLLMLLRKSKIAYHATLGLSCYYFTMALTDAESGNEHADCKQLRWEEVEQETEKCFESLRVEFLALDLVSRSLSITTLERVELMNSITQVIIFEMIMGKSAPWDSHLPAATTLFEEIMANPESRSVYRNQPQSKFASVLLGIGEPLWTNPGPSNHIWSPEQAGFKFCAGLLIFIDIIAHTTFRKTSRLRRFHSEVLAQADDGSLALGDAELRLSSIVGCPNWVVRAIDETSTVKLLRQVNSPTHDESSIPVLGDDVHTDLTDQISKIQKALYASKTSYTAYQSPFDRASLELGPKPSTSSVIALIWGLSARLYYLTALIGWEPQNPKLRADVAQVIELLHFVPPNQLRTLAWPVCIAGCLALENEEPSFRSFFLGLGRTQTAGALNDARQMMQMFWLNRPANDSRHWDLSSCFSIHGVPVLLV